MPSELQTALTLCLSPGQQSTDYQGVVWEFYPPDTLKLIGTDGRRLTIVTLRMPCSEQSRFRMTVDDGHRICPALIGEPIPIHCCDTLTLFCGDRVYTAHHDPREYPPAAGQLQYRHATDSPVSSYDLMDLTTAVSECHMVSNGTVRMDLLTYRGLLIEPVLREDLRVICRVQMALHGRCPQ